MSQLLFSEINRKEIKLTKEEEWLLIAKAQTGDTVARNKVFLSNILFAISEVKKRKMYDLEQDLIQEASIGLLKAIELFDVKSKNKFTSYAVWLIKTYTSSYLLNNLNQIKIPSNICKGISNGKLEKEDYPSTTAYPDEMNDFLLSHSAEQDSFELTTKEENINKILSVLKTDKQRQIVIRRLGLNGEPESFVSIGKSLKLNKETVRMSFLTSIEKIKKNFTTEQLMYLLT